MSRREVFDRVKRATVAVAAMNNREAKQPFTIVGSGFCIDPLGLVVTCRHVVEALMEKTVEQQIAEISPEERGKPIQKSGPFQVITPFAVFYDTKASAENLFVFPSRVGNVVAKTDFDLAMLRLFPHGAFPSGYPALEIEDYEVVAEGDEVGTCGFPLGNYLYEQLGTVTSSFTTGILSSIIPSPGASKELVNGFQLSLTATHGNSGGPVFSLASGKVFGVLQRGVQDTSGGLLAGITKAEPIYPLTVFDLIDRLKKTPPGTLVQWYSG
jgi:S1-C subfamily serine protease